MSVQPATNPAQTELEELLAQTRRYARDLSRSFDAACREMGSEQVWTSSAAFR
jgi:hypothetical protein